MLNLWFPIIFGLVAVFQGIWSIVGARSVEDKFRAYIRQDDRKRQAIRERHNAQSTLFNPVTTLKKKAAKVEPKAKEPVLKANPNKLARPEGFFDEPRQE